MGIHGPPQRTQGGLGDPWETPRRTQGRPWGPMGTPPGTQGRPPKYYIYLLNIFSRPPHQAKVICSHASVLRPSLPMHAMYSMLQ